MNKGGCFTVSDIWEEERRGQGFKWWELLDSTIAEKDLGVLVDSKMTVSQPCTLRPPAAWTAQGTELSAGQGMRSFPSFSQQRWSCGWNVGVQFYIPQYNRDTGFLKKVQWRHWSIFCTRRGWENCDCSAQRSEGSGEHYQCVWIVERRE